VGREEKRGRVTPSESASDWRGKLPCELQDLPPPDISSTKSTSMLEHLFLLRFPSLWRRNLREDYPACTYWTSHGREHESIGLRVQQHIQIGPSSQESHNYSHPEQMLHPGIPLPQYTRSNDLASLLQRLVKSSFDGSPQPHHLSITKGHNLSSQYRSDGSLRHTYLRRDHSA
jgi:hypothetical protein